MMRDCFKRTYCKMLQTKELCELEMGNEVFRF